MFVLVYLSRRLRVALVATALSACGCSSEEASGEGAAGAEATPENVPELPYDLECENLETGRRSFVELDFEQEETTNSAFTSLTSEQRGAAAVVMADEYSISLLNDAAAGSLQALSLTLRRGDGPAELSGAAANHYIECSSDNCQADANSRRWWVNSVRGVIEERGDELAASVIIGLHAASASAATGAFTMRGTFGLCLFELTPEG